MPSATALRRCVKVEKWGNQYRIVVYLAGAPELRNVENVGNVENLSNNVETRLDCNISRAKSRIRELASCNPWSHFATLTLNPDKIIRTEKPTITKCLGNWIGNYNRKYGAKLKYLIIPEQHKDGAWHFHGLLNGIAPDSLVRNEHGYLDMPYYANRFGFISLDPIRNLERCSSYISKYITKDMGAIQVAFGEHLFYASHGLQGKTEIARGFLLVSPEKLGFINDWIALEMTNDEEKISRILVEMEQASGAILGADY